MEKDTVILKDGSEQAKGLVWILGETLRSLFKEGPILAYELVMKARDPQHQHFGNTGDALAERQLLCSDYTMHESTREIIQCSVEGEGYEMYLVSPFAKEAEEKT